MQGRAEEIKIELKIQDCKKKQESVARKLDKVTERFKTFVRDALEQKDRVRVNAGVITLEGPRVEKPNVEEAVKLLCEYSDLRNEIENLSVKKQMGM